MKISVKVTPNAKRRAVVTQEDGSLRVHLTAPAVDGKANKALIILLAEYYHERKSRITIVQGLKSRIKIVHIDKTP